MAWAEAALGLQRQWPESYSGSYQIPPGDWTSYNVCNISGIRRLDGNNALGDGRWANAANHSCPQVTLQPPGRKFGQNQHNLVCLRPGMLGLAHGFLPTGADFFDLAGWGNVMGRNRCADG